MIRFVAQRLARLVVILLVASVLVFAAVYVSPGSPLAALSGGRSLNRQQITALDAHYHLNQPVLTQYWDWLTAVAQGDLGRSVVSLVPVSTLILGRLGTTLVLVGYAAVLIVLLSFVLGATAALRGGVVDTAIVALTGAMAAIPSFVAAAVFVTVFAVDLAWFPALGSGSGVADRLWHLTLPAVALALAGMGFCARVTRTAVLDERLREHVEIAEIRGLPRRRVIRRHILRNATIPVTTAIGITVASLTAGSVVIEQAFGLNGVGSLLVQGINDHDFPVIQGVTLLLVTSFVVINTLVDLLHPLLDPRLQEPGAP